MECKFVVGQKVVCVSVRMTDGTPRANGRYPVVGSVYTVRDIVESDRGDVCILLNEIDNCHLGAPEPAFNHDRFRPAYDIQQFRDIAEKARKTGRITVDA